MTRIFGRELSVILIALSMSGCASLLPKQPYAARADWPLAPAPPPVIAPSSLGKIVVVRAITAGPGLDRRGVASIDPSGAIAYDYYNQWAVDPAAATTGALTQWLGASGAFSAVVDPASRLSPDLIVEGELTEFVADDTAGQARASLTLTVLRSESGGTITLLAQRRLQGLSPLGGTGAAAVIQSERAALADALRQAVAFVAETAAKS